MTLKRNSKQRRLQGPAPMCRLLSIASSVYRQAYTRGSFWYNYPTPVEARAPPHPTRQQKHLY